MSLAAKYRSESFFIGCEAKTKTTGATEAEAINYIYVHLGGRAYDKSQ